MNQHSTETGLAVVVGGAIVVLLTLVVLMAIGDAFAGRASATWAAIAAILAGLAALAQAAFAAIALASLRYNRIAADAANETLKHQQEIAKKQLRAYLASDGFREANSARRLSYVLKNFGATPTGAVSLRGGLIWSTETPDLVALRGTAPWAQYAPVAPGATIFPTLDLPEEPQDGHRHSLYFTLEAIYEDAFGEKRTVVINRIRSNEHFAAVAFAPDVLD